MRPIIATHFDFLIEQYGCQKSERWVSYEFHSEYVKGRIEVDVVWAADGTTPWVTLWDTHGTSEEERSLNWDPYDLLDLEGAEDLKPWLFKIDGEIQYDQVLASYADLIRKQPQILDGDLTAFREPDDAGPIEIEVADPDGTSHIETYSSIDEFVDTHRARKSRSWRVFRSARNFWMSMVLGITLLAMAVYYFL